MRVNFITKANESLASYRYRIEAPALELAKRGHEVSVGDYDEGANIVVFSKHFNMDDDYSLMLKCKEEKTRTVFDICDNHFNDNYGPYYKAMCKQADRIIIGTSEMLLMMDKELRVKTLVINDPYEYPLGKPKFDPEDPKLLWFGHPSNLYSLQRILPEISEYELRVISNTDRMPSIPWSPKSMREGFEWCDLVIIPETERCKGNNRAIESFRAGRMVIAEAHPSLNILPCFTGDIREGIEWARENPKHVLNCIEQGQIDIETLYSPDVIGAQWERALV